jgi:hypothetical protein
LREKGRGDSLTGKCASSDLKKLQYMIAAFCFGIFWQLFLRISWHGY